MKGLGVGSDMSMTFLNKIYNHFLNSNIYIVLHQIFSQEKCVRKYLNYCFSVLTFLNVSNDVNLNHSFVFVLPGGSPYLASKINEAKDLLEASSKAN